MVAIYLRYESNYLLYNGVIESYMAFWFRRASQVKE